MAGFEHGWIQGLCHVGSTVLRTLETYNHVYITSHSIHSNPPPPTPPPPPPALTQKHKHILLVLALALGLVLVNLSQPSVNPSPTQP